MRRVLYRVASSLDGYIAGPGGEIDWIPQDPSMDFGALYAGVDTVLIGRRTYELTQRPGAPPWPAGWRIFVVSRTLRPEEHPAVTVVGRDVANTVARLRGEVGTREIWLFGGGELFRSLLTAGQVDRVEVTVVPVLLGGGVPLLARGAARTPLRLGGVKTHPTGMVTLSYTAAPVS